MTRDMAWSPEKAASAYLETIRLCKLDRQRRYTSSRHSEPHNTELISALAAGMNSKLLLEICSSAAPSTIALAAAARQTGGRLICILSNSDALLDAMVAMKELNLAGVVEFMVGDAKEIVQQFTNVDFALVDCKEDDYIGILELVNLNPTCAVVVADNLFDRNATTAYGNFVKRRPGASSITLPIGKGIEVTRFSRVREGRVDNADKSRDGEVRPTKRENEKMRKGRRVRFFIETEEQSGESEDGWF